MKRPRLNANGSAIILALGFLLVLLTIAAGVHTFVVRQLRASGAERRSVAAEYVAMGGIARAVGWFNSQNYQIPNGASISPTAVPVSLAHSNTALLLPATHPNSYTDSLGGARSGVVVSYRSYLTNQSTSVGTYSVTAALISTQPELWEIQATALVGGVQRQVGALLTRQQDSLFPGALFGRDDVTLNGNAYTDGYDSSLGPYGGANRFETGSVRSNGSISLVGNAMVKGDAIPGPNSSVTTTGNAQVTGLKDPAASTTDYPAATIPSNAANLGNVDLHGNATQTISSGTYYLGDLSISGNAGLIVDPSSGPVTIYVTGSLSIAGNGITNLGGAPGQLSIVQIGNGGASFSGNASFAGTVYAPNSAVSLNGNGTLFGALVGASVSVHGNSPIHYDQSLRNLFGIPGPLRLIAQWMPPD